MWLSNQVVDRLREAAVWPEIADDRYAVIRPIGRGGMGTVYVARDERLGREVALKVSNAPASGSGLDARLRREAHVLATLDHPGIVPVHDAGVLADGRLFYVMKLVRGVTLVQHAASLDSESARLALVERVVETAAFAHARGIVHRDLKPANVMVGPFGEVLVLDWGVAKVLAASRPADALERHEGERRRTPAPADGTPAHRDPAGRAFAHRGVTNGDPDAAGVATRAGTVIGTPGFMAPEQREGDGTRIGPATDVYALGALLFWLLTAATPLTESEAVKALRGQHVPRRLRAIVRRCLAARPADRYPDAGALLDDLVRYRSGRAVDAHPETILDRAGRFVSTYRTFILIIVAYLVMRTVAALLIARG